MFYNIQKKINQEIIKAYIKQNKVLSLIIHGYVSVVFQQSMDLPPDKAKVLKSYDDEKKWDLICDQVNLPVPVYDHRFLVNLQPC